MWMMLAGDEIIVLLLGVKWMPSAYLMKILAISLTFRAIGFPKQRLMANSKTKKMLLGSLWSSLFRIIVIFFGAYYYGTKGAAYAISISVAFQTIVLNVLAFESKQEAFDLLRKVIPFALSAGIAFGIAYFFFRSEYVREWGYVLALLVKTVSIVLLYGILIMAIEGERMRMLSNKVMETFFSKKKSKIAE
jgi:O-antigen/teichoic acid export membrane protein